MLMQQAPGLPCGVVNAPFERLGEFVMRVGIPHRGGRLAFHAFNEGYAAMVSASAFWSHRAGAFRLPRATDLQEVDFALDSAGFTAMQMWKAKGTQPGMAGVFPWTYAEYMELASMSGASWWSQPDLCCEPEIAAELAKTCSPQTVASLLPPPVPVIQGWSPDDYLRSLDLLDKVWSRWQPWLAPPALIGVGSICRRHLHHPKHGLLAVLARLEGALPAASRLHLFGVKGASLSHLKMCKWIASADSMAYDDGARRRAWRGGHSNTVGHRAAEMSRWMAIAARQVAPALGDQYRLRFV